MAREIEANLVAIVRDFVRQLPKHGAELQLSHNPHLGIYQTVAQWAAENEGSVEWCNESARAHAIHTNELWTLWWNPKTPIGSCELAAHSLVELLQTIQERSA